MSNYIISGTDLTAIANAIRAKSGGSSPLAVPDGFVSEVQAIPSGGGAMYGITGMELLSTSDDHTEVTGIFPDLYSLTLPSENNNTIEKIDIQSDKTISIKSGCAVSARGGALKEIDLHMGLASLDGGTGLRYRENLEIVKAKIVVLVTNTNNQFSSASKLHTIYFQENAQDISVNISSCPLSNASLVSLANGLKLGATTSTLTLSTARKTTAQSLMGTVSTVGSGADAYELFTPDETGTLTLAQFITTNKGWTIA